MSNYYKRDTCRLCGSKQSELVLPLTPTALCDAYIPAKRLSTPQETYPLDLFLCKDCGYVYLPYVVDPEIIYRDYIFVTTSSMDLSAHFQGNADTVLGKIQPKTSSLVMDIGSNDGTLLRYFQRKNMRVLGVEPATEIARQATSSGIETLPEFFTTAFSDIIKKKYGTSTIITVNNLYANVDDLEDFTKGIRNLLAPDGVFVMESSYLADMIKNMVFDFIYHEHLSYFSVTPLQAFFRRHDMELIDVERIPTKGGSLRYYVQLHGGPRPISRSVAEFVSEEERTGLHRFETFKTFSEKIDALRKRLTVSLGELRSQGKNLAGYGGSATTTTLLYHFGLNKYIDYIVDDNPAKQHTFSPGYHISVLPSAVLYERKPDYVVILAWRYFDAIVAKHQALLDRGTHFIRPLPDYGIL